MKKTIDKLAVYNSGNILPKIEMRPGTLRAEFIYSFDDRSQQVASYPFVQALFKNEGTFVSWALSELTQDEMNHLLKVSSCIYFVQMVANYPDWFNSRNGKFYFEAPNCRLLPNE